MNYIEDLLILITAGTGCVYISVFAFLVGISIGIMGSAIALKICVITARIKRYKSLIRKKEKKHDKTLSLAKQNVN